MGGRSSEHAISLASARSVIAALDPERYEVVTVEIGRDGRWASPARRQTQLARAGPVPGHRRSSETAARSGRVDEVAATLGEVEVVLPILHGPFGEDGRLQGLLEMADVPYVGADHAASALCMDKDLFKAVMRDQGIPVTRNITLRRRRRAREPVRLPRVRQAGAARLVGRDHEGARRRGARAPAVELAFRARREGARRGVRLRDRGRGRRARQPRADRLARRRDRRHAATSGTTTRRSTTRARWISSSRRGSRDEQTARVQQLAVQAFVATECEGMARVDCFVRDDGEVLINELNTIPGFTSTSVYAKLFEASRDPVPELLDRADRARARAPRAARAARVLERVGEARSATASSTLPWISGESRRSSPERAVGDHERVHG